MTISKNNIIWSVILAIGVAFIGAYVWTSDVQQTSDVVNSPEPSATVSPSATPPPVKSPSATPFVGTVASCELKGEIKFLSSNTYDNQDALFIYNGIDDPARNIMWNVSPQDNIRVGPNIFTRMPLPNGESLLGVFLPDEPAYKRYEITAKIQYGRVVDNFVKVFEKQCDGKTVVVLP